MLYPQLRVFYLVALVASVFLASCAAQETFNNIAQAGNTVLVTAGNIPGVKKDSISITITPSTGILLKSQPVTQQFVV